MIDDQREPESVRLDLLSQFIGGGGHRYADDAIDLVEERSKQPRTQVDHLMIMAVLVISCMIRVIGQ